MNLRPYPTYKASPFSWMPQVPSGWEVRRLKFMTVQNRGGVWGSDYDEEGTIVLRSTDQTVDGVWCISDPAKRALTASERAAALLKEGDLVVTKSSGSADHIGKTTLVDARVASLKLCYSNFMQRLRLEPRLNPRFYWYVLNSELARKQFAFNSDTTTGLANLGQEVIGLLIACEPTAPEQASIVAFLDRETARIDALIGKKRRLLELLEEKRLAVITHAVTRGLDPNAPMKDSGIDWLGEIPAHWDAKRVKFLVSLITSGSRGWAEYYSDEGATFLQSGNLGNKMELDFDFVQHVTPPDGAEGRRTAVSIDDVLVCITGARTGAVAHVSSDLGEAYINQHVALLRPAEGEVFPRFLAYALWSNIGREQLWLSSYGMKEGLGLQHVLAVLLTSPPIDEQIGIVRHLDNQQTVLDRLSSTIQAAINRLTEYRSALITNAVTGKIDVRGEVAKEAAA